MTNAHSKLCDRPKTPGYGESKNELTFTFGRGFKWKVITTFCVETLLLTSMILIGMLFCFNAIVILKRIFVKSFTSELSLFVFLHVDSHKTN